MEHRIKYSGQDPRGWGISLLDKPEHIWPIPSRVETPEILWQMIGEA